MFKYVQENDNPASQPGVDQFGIGFPYRTQITNRGPLPARFTLIRGIRVVLLLTRYRRYLSDHRVQ